MIVVNLFLSLAIVILMLLVINRFLDHVKQKLEAERVELVEELNSQASVTFERYKDIVLCFDANTNRFLGQGRTQAEISDQVFYNLPEKVEALKTSKSGQEIWNSLEKE